MAKKIVRTADQLDEFTQEITETHIYCDRCSNESSDMAPSYIAIKRFFEAGWTATKNKCYCPYCSKKYLKQDS